MALRSLLLASCCCSVGAGLCSGAFGADPVPRTLHDGSAPVQIIDRRVSLQAGTVESWTLHNWGAPAPITLQIWRTVGLRKFRLVCAMDITLKAGLQTIPYAVGGCDVEEGDSIGWWQKDGSAVGSIGIDNADWLPSCQESYKKDMKTYQCPGCTMAYIGTWHCAAKAALCPWDRSQELLLRSLHSHVSCRCDVGFPSSAHCSRRRFHSAGLRAKDLLCAGFGFRRVPCVRVGMPYSAGCARSRCDLCRRRCQARDGCRETGQV